VIDAELLDSLAGVLAYLQEILPGNKEEWDESPLVRLAVERLWITAGNTSEAYRRIVGLPAGVEPWGELAGYRNLLAHALAGDVSPDRVWADTTADLDRIIDEIDRLRGQRQA
jgi:uncharacterized protein with HEPN domain